MFSEMMYSGTVNYADEYGQMPSSTGYGASIRICWKSASLVPLVLAQCGILADKVICVLTYRNHVNNAWAYCCLIAHELLDVSWHSNVTSRNHTLFCYSLR